MDVSYREGQREPCLSVTVWDIQIHDSEFQHGTERPIVMNHIIGLRDPWL